MTKFDEWFDFEKVDGTPRCFLCYGEIDFGQGGQSAIRDWMEAAYNQGFQDGYNSPMPPTDFV